MRSWRSRLAAVLVLLLVVGAMVLAWWLRHRDEPSGGSAARPGAATSRTTDSRQSWQGTLVHVSDGDTVDVDGPDGRVRVRILGIDAPEMAKDGRPAECGAEAARAALLNRVGHQITVVPDTKGQVRDRFGRALAYLEDEGSDIGLQQISAGLVGVWHPRSAAVPSRDAAYVEALRQAGASRAGSWASCPKLGR